MSGKKSRLLSHLFQVRGTIVMSILDKGIPPNARDSQGKTAFGLAALTGQIGTLALLATRGADVNVRDKYRRTPLMVASFSLEFAECFRQSAMILVG